MEKTKKDLALIRMVGPMRVKTTAEANKDKALFYKAEEPTEKRIDTQIIEHKSIFEPKKVEQGFEIGD